MAVFERCPQCGIAAPNMRVAYQHQTKPEPLYSQFFRLYVCGTCNRCTMMEEAFGGEILNVYPATREYSADVPQEARDALKEAADTIGVPSLSIVGAARAVDFMLHLKGFRGGKGTNLAARIRDAADQHVITQDMKAWADEVRLDANAERHADTDSPKASRADAERALHFAEALAEILFELPARVTRGRAN